MLHLSKMSKNCINALKKQNSDNTQLRPVSSRKFVSEFGYTRKTDPGLETERLDIASFVFGSDKSLASKSRFYE